MTAQSRSAPTPAPRPGSFPRGALAVALGLVLISIAASGLGRITGFGTLRMPDAADVAYRDLTFADRADGAVVVRDARDGRLVEVLPAASDGFVRGVLRSLVRERRLRGLGDEAPFRLARRGDGRLALEDRASGAEVVLNAFGATNVEAFARFLNAEGERR